MWGLPSWSLRSVGGECREADQAYGVLGGVMAEELERTNALGVCYEGGARETATGLMWGQGKGRSWGCKHSQGLNDSRLIQSCQSHFTSSLESVVSFPGPYPSPLVTPLHLLPEFKIPPSFPLAFGIGPGTVDIITCRFAACGERADTQV